MSVDFQLNSVHEAGIANSATTSFTTQNQYDSSVSSQHKRYIEEVSAMLGTAQQPGKSTTDFSLVVCVVDSSDDDVPWTVVDLKISSGRRFTPANHTIYLIEEITTSSTIYFDGRKKGLLPPVYNWVRCTDAVCNSISCLGRCVWTGGGAVPVARVRLC